MNKNKKPLAVYAVFRWADCDDEEGGGEVRVVVSGPCDEAGEIAISRFPDEIEKMEELGMERTGKVSPWCFGRFITLFTIMLNPTGSEEKEEEEGPSSISLPSRESFDSLSESRNCSCSLSKRPIWNSSNSILTVVSFVSQFSSSILTEFDSSAPQSPRPKLTMGSILATWEDISGLTILRSVVTCRQHSQRSLTSSYVCFPGQNQ